MQTVEPFGDLEDEWRPNLNTVSLKGGLDLHDLASGKGTEFEIDPSMTPQAQPTEEEESGFDRAELYKHLNYECGIPGDGDDSDDNVSPFERMSLDLSPLTEDRGVLKKVLREGIGPVVPEGAIVRVHYNGYLEYSDEPYDSSRLRNQQQQFRLGRGEVIEGWEVAISSMKKDELSRFMVKPQYAYGSLGCPPRIPKDATIMYEIELMSFVDHKAADDFQAFSRKEREAATLEQLIAVATAEIEAGNDFFKQKIYGKASGKYNRAIRLLEETRLKNEEEERKWKVVLLRVYLNLSLCYLRQGMSGRAITHSRNALGIEPKNVKAHFRLGQAYMQLGEFRKSRDYLMIAGKMSPGNHEIRQELQKLDRAVKKFQAVEKNMYGKMFQRAPAAATASKKTTTESEQKASEETRSLLMDRLRAFKENPDMFELVLPTSLEPVELRCAEEVARELGLETEKRAEFGIKILKLIPGLEASELQS